ncbi:Rz1-like lysis system protein LysC [Sodalis sp. RH15]|uniref:Rz1-like lysis system protein LysC n=1 Tax=Sodalis sp. RH15 TaxID=3394330 RepID=UPI0039B36D33
MIGCAPVPPSPEQRLIVLGYPKVTTCRFPATHLLTNGDLNANHDALEGALALCADKVDTLINGQERNDAQARILTQSPQ